MSQHIMKSKCCIAETMIDYKDANYRRCIGCNKKIKEDECITFCDFCGTATTCPDCGPSIVDFPEDG